MKAKVEDIIHRELLDSTGDINFKVFNGAIENISRRGQNDVLGALLQKQCMKCTKRFRKTN